MNGLKISFIILFILATALTIAIRPDMNQPLVLEDAHFVLAPAVETRTVTVKPAAPAPVQPQTVQTVQQPVVRERIVYVPRPVQQQPVQVQRPVVQQPVSRPVQQPKPQQQAKQPVDVLGRLLEIAQSGETPDPKEIERLMNTPIEIPKQVQNPAPQRVAQLPQQVQVRQPGQLTEAEEIIAWNKWRSDFQNRVMKDSNVSAPMGTIFYFTCVVDKFGNISNINTWAVPQDYTPEAKQRIKPAIANLQGQSILKFPQGTKRTTVTINDGKFGISFSERFSSPGDFSDYERVSR
jgi:hypothetical protein